MYLLARDRGLSEESAFLSAILYTLGGFYAHRLTHGHFEWIATAWIPFIILIIHKNIKSLNKKSICLGGIFLAFLFLDGGPYQFAFLMLFLGIYTVFLAIQSKNTRPICALALVFIIGVSLSSIKLYPVYETVKKYPRNTQEINFYGAPFTPTFLDICSQMFVSRSQSHRPDIWMPYVLNVGCYVGWIPLVLAFTAIIVRPYRGWPLYVTAIIFFWIALGPAAPLNLWEILHRLPGLSALRVPSRFNVFVLLLLALLSGEGMQIIKEKIAKNHYCRCIPILIVAIIAIDLVLVNGKIFKVAFSIPPLEIQTSDSFRHYLKSPYLIEYKKQVLYKTFPNWLSAAFPGVLENRGVINNYRTIPFSSNTIPFEHPRYRGESWFLGEKGRVKKCEITPNKILVETNGHGKILIINMNYDPGWKTRGETALKVFPLRGIIAVELQPGQKKCELAYLPKSFFWGAIISMISLLVIFCLYFMPAKKRIYSPLRD
jgi:uncharacterized membrane protein YfhO